MSSDVYELSVVLPAYNESQRLKDGVRQLCLCLNGLHIPYEIIIVDDGSLDDTLAQARQMESDVIKVFSYSPNKGKGSAINYGMRRASGKYVLFMDVDLATPLETIKEFYDLISVGECDLIIGDRKSRRSRQPVARQILGRGFTWLSQKMLGCTVNDFTCGFKMFTRPASDIIFPRQKVTGWAFDAEIIFIAYKYRLRICQKAVRWNHQPGSKVRLGRDVVSSLQGLMQVRLNDWQGLYT